MNNKDTNMLPEITVPLDIIYYNYGLNDEFISSLNTIFYPNIIELSRYIEVFNLEAITFTCEDYYEDALNNIDRGFNITNRITPSKGGAAMTLPLKREGNIKCHIVFNVDQWTFNENNLLTNHTLSIIAHEMVHVEIISSLHKYEANICFPKSFYSLKQASGFALPKLSIEEFGACKRTYVIDDQNISLKGFEFLLIEHLNEIDVNQIIFVNEFKDELNNNIDYYEACLNYAKKSYKNYEKLLILSSYYLGSKNDSVEYHVNIKNHELFKYIQELLILLNEAYKNYPSWQDSNFSNIKNLLEKILINEAKINFRKGIFGEDYFTVNL